MKKKKVEMKKNTIRTSLHELYTGENHYWYVDIKIRLNAPSGTSFIPDFSTTGGGQEAKPQGWLLIEDEIGQETKR